MIRILVVGKDAHERYRLSTILERLGCQAEEASDPREARRRLRRGRFSLLLLDCQLDAPEEDFALLRDLPSFALGTLPIFVTHEGGLRDYQRAFRLGAVDVLVRPFSEAEVQEAVFRAMDCLAGFRGSVHGVSLVDLLQLFHLSRRSVSIEVAGQEGGGLLVLDKGDVTHAEVADLSGEDALLFLLSMDGGSLRSLPYRELPRNIEGAFQGVLFEALRRLDEGEIPDSIVSRRRIAVGPSTPSTFPSSALPPQDARLVALKAFVQELDPAIALSLISNDHGYPLLPGNIGEGALLSLGNRFLARLSPLSLQWRQLQWYAGRGGVCLLSAEVGVTLLAARRWTSSSEERYFRRNMLKIEEFLVRQLCEPTG